jgi:hypothetical protein
MADESINQPEPIVEAPKEPSRAEERITQLSDKVRQEAEGRVAAEAKATEAERKAAFAEGFVDIVATNPEAKDFKADIQAKVMAGYSVQDATFAVLGAAGKFGSSPTPTSPAGGSASTTIPQGGDKPVAEMTQDERRAKLAEQIVWQ